MVFPKEPIACLLCHMSRSCDIRSSLVVVLVMLVSLSARAQPAPAPDDGESQPADLDDPSDSNEPATDEIDQAVARALLERARVLFGQGDYSDAKSLLVECLRRRAEGPHSRDALALLREVNGRLGVAADDGVPAPVKSSIAASTPADGGDFDQRAEPSGETANPLNGGKPGEDWGAPIDPYGESSGSSDRPEPENEPIELPGNSVQADAETANGDSDTLVDVTKVEGEADKPADSNDRRGDLARGRRTLMVYGGIYGFLAGLALAGPEDEFGQVGGGALVAGVAASAAGMLGAHHLTRRRPYSEGQAAVIGWSGVWSGAFLGYFSDVLTGIDNSSTNEIYKGIAIGGAVGTGLGLALASKLDPSPGDVSLTNSMGMYGMLGSLLLGVAMDPAESEAFSINAMVGTALGLGTGLYAAKRIDTSRRRMLWIDAGAGIGAAAPWILVYPFIRGEGDDDSSAQTVGVLSLIGMFGGGYLAWRLTHKLDRRERIGKKQLVRRGRPGPGRAVHLPPPGLLQRSADGSWGVGVPSFRPAENPALAASSAKPGLAIDLLSGRF